MSKFFLFTCILFSGVAFSQQSLNGTYRGSDGIPRNLEIPDASGQPIPIGDHSNINGSPLLQEKWTFGTIKLKNGISISDSAINYSLFNNEVFFKRNDDVYPISYPVKEFSLKASDGSKTYRFQNGFPSINRNDSLTFYQILYAGNSLKLLKWNYKKIKELFNYNSTFQNEYLLVQQYFIFLSQQHKMIDLGLRVSLNELRKELPDYSGRAEVYKSQHKINAKNDDDLIKLFTFLDPASIN